MDEYQLQSYFYELPQELIAQTPPSHRGQSRLMVVDRNGRLPVEHTDFSRLCEFLPSGALLIANNSKVLSARMTGTRSGGGKAEFLLLTPLPLLDTRGGNACVDGLIRPAAKIRVGDRLKLGGITAEILAKEQFGRCKARLEWNGDLETEISKYGKLPLPPYIRREAEAADLERYQTVYASQPGSIAAPTAGLHFTDETRASLEQAGFEWREISLHVGYGTFSPVRSSDIRSHRMHSEYAIIPAETAAAIRKAKHEGRKLIAIGTTSARAIEGAWPASSDKGFAGLIDIFLYPGKTFNAIDGLITNFHLPCSSLLMLASAFAGRKNILRAYSEAIEKRYHFFSYGDAMLILGRNE